MASIVLVTILFTDGNVRRLVVDIDLIIYCQREEIKVSIDYYH